MASAQPTPALPPPPGQTSNFVNPDSLSKWTILCVTVCLSVTGIVFVLRTYVRVVAKRTWILEDYMCCISWAGLAILCGLLITMVYQHGGVHEWDLTAMEVHRVSYWFYIARVTYGLTIMCTKLTILLFYRRVFLPQRWSVFDVATRLLMLIICLFYITTSGIKLFECTPRSRIWDKSIGGRCIDISRLLNTSGLFNTITDVLILLVPLKSVWKLNMSMGRKVACVLLFTVGLIAPIFSVIGFIVRLRISANPDITYTQPEILLWSWVSLDDLLFFDIDNVISTAEISTGVVCVCLPTLGALGHRRRHRPSTSILNGHSYLRSIRSLGPDQPTSLNDKELLDSEYLEVRDRDPRRSNAGSKYAVITAIRGGASTPSTDAEGAHGSSGRRPPETRFSPTSDIEMNDQSAIAPDGGGGIMKSFRIEQSYS
ncbi:hypothetical protein MMC29_001771 [Sticta canariensis]|nr:hypothetical protein [Sticta canariensis]